MLQTGRSPFVKGSKYIYMHRIFSPSSGGVEAFEVTACHYIILLYESGWVPTGVHFVQKVGCSLCPRILFSDFRNSPNTPCEVGNCLLTMLSKGEVGRLSAFLLQSYERWKHIAFTATLLTRKTTQEAGWEGKRRAIHSKGGKHGDSEERPRTSRVICTCCNRNYSEINFETFFYLCVPATFIPSIFIFSYAKILLL